MTEIIKKDVKCRRCNTEFVLSHPDTLPIDYGNLLCDDCFTYIGSNDWDGMSGR